MAKWRKNNLPEAGVTLIGVLVATLVFASMLLAITQLLARSQKNVGLSREEFIATNLAREGLELVQYLRDKNWLAPAPVLGWTGATGNNTPLCLLNTTTWKLKIWQKDNRVKLANIVNNQTPTLFLNSVNQYVHDDTGKPTPFSRTITIDCTHRNEPNNEHILVTAQVDWASRGQQRSVSVKTKLYNWYQ